MDDRELVKAVCGLAGADSDVTVEEMALLGGLARHAGLETAALNSLIAKTCEDADFRDRQIAVVTNDTDATMKKVIPIAREVGSHDEGHVAMLLWRIATKLEIGAARFEELLAADVKS